MRILNKKIIDLTSANTFGLDVGDFSIKAVQMEKEGKGEKIKNFCAVELPQGAVKDGEIMKPDIVISKIKELCLKGNSKPLKIKKAICSLPESKAFLRIINMPEMEKEEMEEAIKWEIEANIPLSLENVCYDWQILGNDFEEKDKKMTVLILAISKEIVTKFLNVMEKAGIEVVGIEVESTAQVRSLLNKKEKNKTHVIVDIGRYKTGFIISYNGVPSFTSSFPIGVKSIIDSIEKDFNISQKEAEDMMKNEGIGNFTKKDPVFKATESVLENLISEMEKSIDFYLNSLQYSSQVDSILICGGGGNLKGLVPYLSKRFENEIKIGNPWANFNLKKKIPAIDREESLQYTTAIGLALKKFRCDLNCQFR